MPYQKKNASPAYLFFGPRGVGKTTLARLIARRVNCLKLQDGEPCGDCDSCVAIENSSSLDVIEIDAASHRGIDHIRELRENVKFRPMQFYKKVYIIDEVHMLTSESFNALLKTLEEPPEHVIFILATTESQKVPQTILSRCLVFNLTKVPLGQLQDHLKHLCKLEKINFEDEAIFWIARTGDGSLRDSISFLEQCIHYCGEFLDSKSIKELLGMGPKLFEYFVDFTLILLEPNSKIVELINIVRENFEAGLDLQRFVWEYLDFLRSLSFVKNGVFDHDFLALPKEHVQVLQTKFEKIDPAFIQLIFQEFFALLTRAQGLDLRNTFEMSVLVEMELMLIKEKLTRPSLSQVIQRLNQFSAALAINNETQNINLNSSSSQAGKNTDFDFIGTNQSVTSSKMVEDQTSNNSTNQNPNINILSDQNPSLNILSEKPLNNSIDFLQDHSKANTQNKTPENKLENKKESKLENNLKNNHKKSLENNIGTNIENKLETKLDTKLEKKSDNNLNENKNENNKYYSLEHKIQKTFSGTIID